MEPTEQAGDEEAGDVAAMLFAGGSGIAALAAQYERSAEWVEESIRRALLRSFPRRDGGTKAPRADERAEAGQACEAWRESQGRLEW